MMFKGKLVVLALVLLTAVVGALFVTLGPKALKTSPGVLHLGIRYADERSMDFTRHPKGGPGARLKILDAKGKQVLEQRDMQIGRNLIPIDRERLIEGADYLLQIDAEGYKGLSIPATLSGRSLNPAPQISPSSQEHRDYSFESNLLGVRLYPVSE